MAKDQRLVVEVKDDELVVRIGIDTLAFAANESDAFKPWDDRVEDWVQKFKVVDPIAFAGDVKRAMLDEAEDGSSPLSRFLDNVDEAALDDGADGIEFPE
jgi:hypothetical protein